MILRFTLEQTRNKMDGQMERETWIDEEKWDRVIVVITLMVDSRWWVSGCLPYNSFSSAVCLKNCRRKYWGKKIPRVVVGIGWIWEKSTVLGDIYL